MRKSRFTEEQIIAILTEQERGMATAEVCRKHGVSPAAFINGKPSSAAWVFPMHANSKLWRQRTPV